MHINGYHDKWFTHGKLYVSLSKIIQPCNTILSAKRKETMAKNAMYN